MMPIYYDFYRTCKALSKLASEVLNLRIKPLIITNGIINDTNDQQILFSVYEQTRDVQTYATADNFLMFKKWQPRIALLFHDCEKQFTPCARRYFQIIPYIDRFAIRFRNLLYRLLSNNCPQSVVIIPKMLDVAVNVIHDDSIGELSSTDQWEIGMPETKLIIAFRGEYLLDMLEFFSGLFDFPENVMLPSDIESDINSIIVPFIENHSLPICYALHSEEKWSPCAERIFLMFSGSNVEASTFLVEATNEEELKEKLLEWKPVTSRLSASELNETGLIYCNRTTKAKRNPGPVYAIIGYKKF
ncbi:unnamed protein product [Onchocerca ochengi]|uniref:Uncharacterized protein n=1 Tax=Onchocerca ochengi TaxID=42157 RepID=A0A182EGH6_ONCOC|nr:unnamed protein product [Onchocerca ochengi]